MQSFLRADRPPGDEQCLVVDRDRVRVDDPEVDSADSLWVDIRGQDGDGGGDVDDETSRVDEQGHGADLLCWIRRFAVEA